MRKIIPIIVLIILLFSVYVEAVSSVRTAVGFLSSISPQYRLENNTTSTLLQDWTNTGVTEDTVGAGFSNYKVTISITTVGDYVIKWRDSSTPTKIAIDVIGAAEVSELINLAAVKAQTDKIQFDASNYVRSAVAAPVTVGTNNDKTGYSLTQAFPTNFASLAITAGGAVTAGTVSDKTGYTVSTVQDKTGYSLTVTPPTASQISTQIWSESLPGTYTSGQAGFKLNAAASAGDPWSTSIPGAYGAGSAGYIVGNNLNASMTSRLASSSYTSPPSAQSISTQVWSEAVPGSFTSGQAGYKLNAAASAGDPWGTSLPGAYGAGTAGYLIGTNVNATIGSRLATTGYTAPDNTSITSIKGQTDKFLFDGSSYVKSVQQGGVTVTTNNDKTGYTVSTVSDKTGYSLTQGFPTNFSSLAITSGGAVTAGTVSDKTGYTVSTVSDKTGYSLATAPPTAAAISTQVWSEAVPGAFTSGQAGYKLNAAASAGDPWTTALPGAYGAGTAGYIIGTDINATISSRLASASYTAPPSAASISTQVWSEPVPGSFTSGMAGYKLNSAASAGDPWATSIPGAYSAGTAGYIVGNDLNATISSRLATSGYTAPDNTSITAIKAKTDNLPTDPASTTNVNTRASQTSVNAIPTNPLLTNDSRIPATLIASSAEVAKQTTLNTLIPTALSFTGGFVNSNVKSTDNIDFTTLEKTTLNNLNITIDYGLVASNVWGFGMSSCVAGDNTCQKLLSAGAAGDPLASVVPGGYASGTAGYILGNNLDWKASSLASAVNQVPGVVDNSTVLLKKTAVSSTNQVGVTSDNKVYAYAPGSGGGGSGCNISGSSSVTVAIYETGTTTPIPDVTITVLNSTESVTLGAILTNSLGQAAFTLDDGTYVLYLRKSGVSFTKQTMVVAGTTSVTYYGTPVSVGVPGGNSCRVYLYAMMPDGVTPLPTIKAQAKIVRIPYQVSNTYFSGQIIPYVYDKNTGLLYWDVVQGAIVEFSVDTVYPANNRKVPFSSNAKLKDLGPS